MKYGTLVRLPNGSDLAAICDQKFAAVQQMGLEACQLIYKPPVYHLEDADIIRSSADAHGIDISAQFCGYYDTNYFWDENFDRTLFGINSIFWGGKRIDYLLSAIPFLQRLNLTDMIIHAGFIPDNPHAPEYDRMLAAVALLGTRLKENGMNLLFETGGESPITMLRLFQDTGLDNLYVNLDTANLITSGLGNPVDAMYTYGHLVRNVHAKDGLPPTVPGKTGVQVEIGTGYVDFDKVIKALHDHGYERYLIIEREVAGGNQEQGIRDAFDYLKKIVNKYY